MVLRGDFVKRLGATRALSTSRLGSVSQGEKGALFLDPWLQARGVLRWGGFGARCTSGQLFRGCCTGLVGKEVRHCDLVEPRRKLSKRGNGTCGRWACGVRRYDVVNKPKNFRVTEDAIYACSARVPPPKYNSCAREGRFLTCVCQSSSGTFIVESRLNNTFALALLACAPLCRSFFRLINISRRLCLKAHQSLQKPVMTLRQ